MLHRQYHPLWIWDQFSVTIWNLAKHLIPVMTELDYSVICGMSYGKVNCVKPNRNIKIRRKESILNFAYKTIQPFVMSIKDMHLEFVALKVANIYKKSQFILEKLPKIFHSS